MEKTNYHIPVLLNEVLAYLDPKPGQRFIDATMGGGGHTRALAEAGAQVLAIDHDQDAITESKQWIADFPTVTVMKGSFEHITEIALDHSFTPVDGVLFDLGVSSHQFDEGARGFSFQHDAPLDMRMSQDMAVSAADLIAALGENEMTQLFTNYGEEVQPRRIARVIIEARKKEPIMTTNQLATIIEQAVGKQGKIHPATKVFQALRIAVNDELEVLKSGLGQSLNLLGPDGRIAVISFHSLEDRIVKQQFKAWEDSGFGRILTQSPIEASETEQQANRRSRSAKLRVFKNEKTVQKLS